MPEADEQYVSQSPEPVSGVVCQCALRLRYGEPYAKRVRHSVFFDKPFIYDKRKGALILQARFTDGGYVTDADFVPPDRGYFLYYGPSGDTMFSDEMLATQFSYRSLPVITGLEVVENVVRIRFESPSVEGSVLEGAALVEGPYAVEQDAKMVPTGANMAEVMPSVPVGKRFWRVRVVDATAAQP